MKKAIQIEYNDLFEKKCRYVKKVGFEHIDVDFYDMLGKTENEWDNATDHILQVLSDNGLECVQSHPYYYDLTLSSEINKEDCEFSIERAIITSGKIGAKWCALHPRTAINTEDLVSKSLKDNQKSFARYLEIAKKNNTGIAVENLTIYPGWSSERPCYSSNYEELYTLVDSFNDSSVGICWDTGHANLMHFNQADAIEFLGDRIKITHIHNNYGKEDNHLPPDDGCIDWKAVMGAFKTFGYDGSLTLEIGCPCSKEEFLNFAKHNYGNLVCLEKLMEE